MKLKLIAPGTAWPFKIEIAGWELTGTYRPMVAAEVAAYVAELAKAKPGAETEKVRAGLLAPYVLTWDATDEAGRAAPTSADAVAALPPFFVGCLEDRVTGKVFEPEVAGLEKK